ncbi:BglG family transcription antiterminator [Halobacillus salinarum]|uniref:Ascorbate-specific PTS system EIIA component n=1 Tax=Halobacillus salinarum TaxID=2932257 RepID=A0ABY4EQ13_9BACI|nr:BglG family transcription antiterminator [Halobacillus salinarum]UOQ46551.1 BglG family transcription antiterminator [Halobacillus salinarum]
MISIRSKKIIDELLSNPSIKSIDLEKKLNLTSRQLGYSIQKLNDWLMSNSLPVIERTRQGHFLISEDVFIALHGENSMKPSQVLTEQQRVYILILMVVSSQEELSLNHFTCELLVSKNTILNDLRQAQDYLNEYELSIQYTRKHGYRLKGKEIQIRKLFIGIMHEVLQLNSIKEKLNEITQINEGDIHKFIKRIEKVEDTLNIKFTDEKLEMMPYIIILILRRVNQGKEIITNPINYEDLVDTKEYQASEEIFCEYRSFPIAERLFITLHLLTTNVHSSELITEEPIPNLMPAINEVLHMFEKNACIYFQDRQQLLNSLFQHIKPAYYRIKYNLTDTTLTFQLPESNEFKELNHLVKRSIGSLEKLIGTEIPESEITYITMLIGGWMKRQGKSIEKKVKAIVVCPQGVSVSRLMFNELKELFPEFILLDSLSIREFENYDLDYDLVFASSYLETEKKLFLTKAFLNEEDKRRLKKQVMLETNGYLSSQIDMNEVMDIIKSHSRIDEEDELLKDLQNYLNRDDQSSLKQTITPSRMNLLDLIRKDTIVLKKTVDSWEEALTVASKPLIDNGSISESYLEAMLNNKKDPYIVISPHVAIPHASPEDGVHELAMSLLKIEEGVDFQGERIHLVFIVAAIDRKLHIRPLTQLTKLVTNEDRKARIIHSQTPEAVQLNLQQNQKSFERG